MMPLAVHEIIGTLGSMLIVVTYLLLQLRRMEVTELRYSFLNAAGAGFILYSLSVEFNLAAFLIESFWLLISFIGLARVLILRCSADAPPGADDT